jgi:hypothetical protein
MPLYLRFLAFSNSSRSVETVVRSLSVMYVISSAFAAVSLFNSRSFPHTHTCYSALVKLMANLFLLNTTSLRRPAPRTLNYDIKWGWVISFTPRPLYSRSKDRRMNRTEIRSGRCDKEISGPSREPNCNSCIIHRFLILMIYLCLMFSFLNRFVYNR